MLLIRGHARWTTVNVSSNLKTLRKRCPAGGRTDRGDVVSEKLLEIPLGVLEEIEQQRDVLVTVITLLYSLHVVLEHQQENVDEELNLITAAAVSRASLPEMTAMILERTLAVLSALDVVNLSRARETKS